MTSHESLFHQTTTKLPKYHSDMLQGCDVTMVAATTFGTSNRWKYKSFTMTEKTKRMTQENDARIPKALVSWCQRHVLCWYNTPILLVLMLLMMLLFVSTNNNSFGYAWTITTKASNRHSYSRMLQSRRNICHLQCSAVSTTDTDSTDMDSSAMPSVPVAPPRPLCFYRSPINNRRWKQRIDIQNLFIGQELQGVIVQEKLSNTTTGPKLWLDVGVCRWSSKGKPYFSSKDITNMTHPLSSSSSTNGGWKICTALLRLGMNHYVKESVVRKKVTRLRSRDTITVYVSRIFRQEGRFDVVLTPEEIPTASATGNAATSVVVSSPPPLQSVTKLNVGDKITGTVTKVVDYGAFIQLDGYNRGGLLHIKQVAELYNTYIDKKQGLMDSGLNPKARVRLQVIEKEKKRILLDFTDDVKQIAMEEQRQEQEEIERQQNELRAQLQQQREKSTNTKEGMIATASIRMTDVSSTSDAMDKLLETPTQYDVSARVNDTNDFVDAEDDVDANDGEEGEGEEEEEYDNYDEERDIEDALGLGMY